MLAPLTKRETDPWSEGLVHINIPWWASTNYPFSNLSCSPPLSQSCFSQILTGRLKKGSDCNQVRGQGIELSWGERQAGAGMWKSCMVPIAYTEWYKAHFEKKNQIFMEPKVTTVHSFALQYCIWETCLIKRHIYLCFLNVMLCNVTIL